MTNVDEAATASGEPGRPGKPGDTSGATSAKKQMPLWQETILLLVLALLLAIIIKSLFVQAFYIPSPSMEPQFIENDRILVQKVSYWGGGSPSRGDIIVFKDPGGWLDANEGTAPRSPVTKVLEKIGLYPTGGHLVKRVIGIGGDRVVCCDAKGRVTVNGKALNEKAYLPKGDGPVPDQVRPQGPQGPPVDDGRQPRASPTTRAATWATRVAGTSTRASSSARSSP